MSTEFAAFLQRFFVALMILTMIVGAFTFACAFAFRYYPSLLGL